VTAGSGSEPVIVKGFDISFTKDWVNTGVMIGDVNGNLLTAAWYGSLTFDSGKEVSINPWTSHEFTVTTDVIWDGSYIAKVVDINYTVDGTPYLSSSSYNNVANWSTLTASWRVSQ
jgi:hypothetical protein